MDELITMTAAELSAAMAAGEVSAADVTEAHLDRIAAVDDRVKAFLHVAADDARARAREVDARRKAGEPLGPLAGVPVAVPLRPAMNLSTQKSSPKENLEPRLLGSCGAGTCNHISERAPARISKAGAPFISPPEEGV